MQQSIFMLLTSAALRFRQKVENVLLKHFSLKFIVPPLYNDYSISILFYSIQQQTCHFISL